MNPSVKLKPFDTSLVEDTSMYDNLPYKRDPYRCNADAIALESGNVLKFYQCKLGDTYKLTDMDTLADKKIHEHQEKESERLAEISKENIEVISAGESSNNHLTDDELHELMEDKDTLDFNSEIVEE